MAIRVRPLEHGDRKAWDGLFRDYIAFYRALVTDSVIDLTWQRMMADPPGICGLVAVDDEERPVGFALVVFHLSTWSPTGYAYLEDLYVAPAVRGQGVGQALIEAVYREADARGATRTYWVTEETNIVARRLYDRLAKRAGFVQYRR